jgi:hypothetical protein
MKDGAAAMLMNSDIGARLLRDRGRTRSLLAHHIMSRRRRRLRLFLAHPELLRPKGRPGGICVSLTSWRPRLDDLPLVLLGLLEQTIIPESIYVWLTPEDKDFLDTTVHAAFVHHGVQFLTCDDLGPHKKWLPLLERGVTNPFVICDDDILYPADWLERLAKEDRADAYVGARCHRISWTSDGALLPYVDWAKNVDCTEEPAGNLFITGCGGAIIHPERLLTKFRDRQRIMDECPHADDIWLKAAHAAVNVPCYKTRYSFPCLEIPGAQAHGLMVTNVDKGQNDRQMGILHETMRDMA